MNLNFKHKVNPITASATINEINKINKTFPYKKKRYIKITIIKISKLIRMDKTLFFVLNITSNSKIKVIFNPTYHLIWWFLQYHKVTNFIF